jgi:PPOX class probable F420-dependent enzyme
MRIDTSTPFGERVARRLREDVIVWLTTVGPDQTPQPSPVWFLQDDGEFLIYSRPDTPKLRNIGRSPRVALHLDGDRRGDDIVILTGQARIVPDHPPADQVPAYLEKYRQLIAHNGMTPDSFARDYSVAIRVTPTTLRGY